MLVDAPNLEGTTGLIVENVVEFPTPIEDLSVYLTEPSNGKQPGLYMYSGGAWRMIMYTAPLVNDPEEDV